MKALLGAIALLPLAGAAYPQPASRTCDSACQASQMAALSELYLATGGPSWFRPNFVVNGSVVAPTQWLNPYNACYWAGERGGGKAGPAAGAERNRSCCTGVICCTAAGYLDVGGGFGYTIGEGLCLARDTDPGVLTAVWRCRLPPGPHAAKPVAASTSACRFLTR